MKFQALALFLVLLSCDPSTANGTALFITVDWPGSISVQQLRFGGVSGTTSAFDTKTLPASANGELTSPQTARAFLSDSLGGMPVQVGVDGLGANGTTVARGRMTVDAVKGREVDVKVTLEAVTGGTGGGGGSGGGSAGGSAGGAAGGAAGGSAGGAAGGTAGGNVVSTCNCDGGCCAQGSSTCSVGNTIYYSCGPGKSCDAGLGLLTTCGNSTTCTSPPEGCDLFHADRCINGGCSCGIQGAPCAPGLLCFGGQCFCTAFTCGGCCTPDAGQCLGGTAPAQCGNSANVCDRCDGGTGMCSNGGVCARPVSGSFCDAGQCASGTQCVDRTFPRCGPVAVPACNWCDPLKSDRCGPIGECACGNRLMPCPADQTCIKVDGGAADFCYPNFP